MADSVFTNIPNRQMLKFLRNINSGHKNWKIEKRKKDYFWIIQNKGITKEMEITNDNFVKFIEGFVFGDAKIIKKIFKIIP